MSRFRVIGVIGVPMHLSFGEAGQTTITLDNFGRVIQSSYLPEPPWSTAEEYARLAIPAIVERYRAKTGLLRFGKSQSARREALLQYVAAALNEGV